MRTIFCTQRLKLHNYIHITLTSGSFDKSSADGRPKKSDKSSGKQMQSSKLRDLPMISEKSGTPSEVSGNDWKKIVNIQICVTCYFYCYLFIIKKTQPNFKF